VQQNKCYWNELADVHFSGTAYPIKQVIGGESSLRWVEIDMLTKYAGKRILHSHCHIGLDTVSIARTNAHVTGMDFSERAIVHAREIARFAGVANCKFFVADSSGMADDTHSHCYDVYFATYGVLVWVPDVAAWFRAAASYLQPGGRLILVDEHPIAATFAGGTDSEFPKPIAPYYEALGSYTTNNTRSYSGDSEVIRSDTQVKWPHSMADILNGALSGGFSINTLDEHPFSHYRSTATMTQGDDRYYRDDRWTRSIPFLFTLVLQLDRPGEQVTRGV
jgi:ubiquinone/menaquinone biosynthesis C-methylase UbiE